MKILCTCISWLGAIRKFELSIILLGHKNISIIRLIQCGYYRNICPFLEETMIFLKHRSAKKKAHGMQR